MPVPAHVWEEALVGTDGCWSPRHVTKQVKLLPISIDMGYSSIGFDISPSVID